jgi:FKBP-type peptidyl-prolyl cis-trans isomerase
MRSFVYLVLLGASLLTLAIVVRSGIFARKNPGEPINSAMRSAMAETSPQLTTEDALEISRKYPTAYTTASGLMFVDRDPGTGTARPHVGDSVTVNYAGRFLDGTAFDSSHKSGRPLVGEVGSGAMIKGVDEAVRTMRKGARRTLIIPYWLAYGVPGRPPLVPPRATLVIDVELVEFH